VEGKDDLYSVVGLMRGHVEWPQDVASAPVYIRDCDGKEGIFADGFLAAVLKQSGLRALGVLVDADENCQSCYERVRVRCVSTFPTLPRSIPHGGLIVENADGLRLGVWIMPDNASSGDLETFLRYLVPKEMEPLWMHAVESADSARGLGAPHTVVQVAKANIHTWLAWQEPPGQPLGIALTAKVLDPASAEAQPFVDWFRSLYGL
jgi:hypothetical protein